MFFIQDSYRRERGGHDYPSLDAALEGMAEDVSYSERLPKEFPFYIINRATGVPVLTINLA